MFVLSEVRVICHGLNGRVCILLEKNIGPPTKAMYHGGSFSLDINPQSLMRICLCIKEESIIYFLCCPGMDVLKLRSIKNEKSNAIDLLGPLYRWHRGTPL